MSERAACPSRMGFQRVPLRETFTLARLPPMRTDWKSMQRLLGQFLGSRPELAPEGGAALLAALGGEGTRGF